MAINKNGTGYTFGFAIVMVVVVGAALAATAISLKPLQQANAADKKMMDILGAIKVDAQRDNAKTAALLGALAPENAVGRAPTRLFFLAACRARLLLCDLDNTCFPS